MMCPSTSPDLLTALSNADVLIVDDDKNNFDILAALLRKAHIENTTYAQNIEQAFEIIENSRPHIILLDIMMPGVSGFDFCTKLKKIPAYAQIPVIFVSALRGTNIRTKAFNLGGVDYLEKPYNLNETIARIRVHLQNALLLDTQQKLANSLKEELDLGAKVQQSLLPNAHFVAELSQKHGCQIKSVFIPSGALAGDFWQLLPIDSNQFAIAICDFSGHGVASALQTARFHSLLYELSSLWPSPETLLKKLNQRLYKMLPPETFATFQCALVNSQEKTALVINAGSPAFLHVQAGVKANTHLQPSLPLGVTPTWQAANTPLKLNLTKDDTLVFYSDALSDISLKDEKNDPFSQKSLHQLKSKHFNARDICDYFLHYHACADPEVCQDDLTIVSCNFFYS